MNRIILHVDMDAFFAAVEIRDNPDLANKPLIIGALPEERGVVSTCSYEARRYGVRSAMSIKDAYRRCPGGVYMHPNMEKYRTVSSALHKIWGTYTDIVEYVSLDEGYLDITGSAQIFGGAMQVALAIRQRTKDEMGLTCSVGIGYSMASAKLASEEKKPDGLFELPDPESFVDLIIDRGVRVLLGIGAKTAEKLEGAGIHTVRDIRRNRWSVIEMLGKQGQQIVQLADGIDDRPVTPYTEGDTKSIGREVTFQQDTTDYGYLEDVLVLLARDLSIKIRNLKLYCRTVTLKVTYGNMRSITRSKSGESTNLANDIYRVVADLLGTVDKEPIRLIGISLQNLTEDYVQQLTLENAGTGTANPQKAELANKLAALQRKYGTDIIKTGTELDAEKRLNRLIGHMSEDTHTQ